MKIIKTLSEYAHWPDTWNTWLASKKSVDERSHMPSNACFTSFYRTSSIAYGVGGTAVVATGSVGATSTALSSAASAAGAAAGGAVSSSLGSGVFAFGAGFSVGALTTASIITGGVVLVAGTAIATSSILACKLIRHRNVSQKNQYYVLTNQQILATRVLLPEKYHETEYFHGISDFWGKGEYSIPVRYANNLAAPAIAAYTGLRVIDTGVNILSVTPVGALLRTVSSSLEVFVGNFRSNFYIKLRDINNTKINDKINAIKSESAEGKKITNNWESSKSMILEALDNPGASMQKHKKLFEDLYTKKSEKINTDIFTCKEKNPSAIKLLASNLRFNVAIMLNEGYEEELIEEFIKENLDRYSARGRYFGGTSHDDLNEKDKDKIKKISHADLGINMTMDAERKKLQSFTNKEDAVDILYLIEESKGLRGDYKKELIETHLKIIYHRLSKEGYESKRALKILQEIQNKIAEEGKLSYENIARKALEFQESDLVYPHQDHPARLAANMSVTIEGVGSSAINSLNRYLRQEMDPFEMVPPDAIIITLDRITTDITEGDVIDADEPAPNETYKSKEPQFPNNKVNLENKKENPTEETPSANPEPTCCQWFNLFSTCMK
tara:strand:+ start:217 stop:2055 length:1839 start_codon:yes stop_codon:yes gene_type:complete